MPDFSTWAIRVAGRNGSTATFGIGSFVNALVSFLLVVAVIFFLVVLPMNAVASRLARPAEPPAPPTPTEVEPLVEIRGELRRRGA